MAASFSDWERIHTRRPAGQLCVSPCASVQAKSLLPVSPAPHFDYGPLPGSMILTTTVPEKSLDPVSLKDRELLDPNLFESGQDATDLSKAMSHLHDSGWYWGSLTAAQAKQVLREAPEGTFLLRDSSYQGFILTLSMTTSMGPTHLRIQYSGGMFGFDSVGMARLQLQRFESAVELVQHYYLTYRHLATQKTELESQNDSVSSSCLAAENSLQMKLIRPLHKVSPSLQHLCRVTINQHSRNHHYLPLPGRLKNFLLEYPFVL
ncbi:suppressor of cytokine signaling 2-like [Aplochiton taeniatus]